MNRRVVSPLVLSSIVLVASAIWLVISDIVFERVIDADTHQFLIPVFVALDSQEGCGTTFPVELPVAEPAFVPMASALLR